MGERRVERRGWILPEDSWSNEKVTMLSAGSMWAANRRKICPRIGLVESARPESAREETMPHVYADPVAKLLTHGGYDSVRRNEPWPDYLELGFTEEHVPELIRMATDGDLNKADRDSLEVWAPLHAWRALGQLRAESAARPLVRLLEQFKDDDWLNDELPEVFSLIGPAAITTLAAFLGDEHVEEICRISVPECLERIALNYSGSRDACVGVLARQLEKCETNGPTLNGFLVLSLTNLKATEAIDEIRKAFADDYVDLVVQGDVEDVEMEMGLRTQRSTPRPRLSLFHELLNFGDINGLRPAPVRHSPKVGRNDPCPCGSGKKFKKCCLNAPAPAMRAGAGAGW